jgi:hypothetical protein
MAPCAVVGLCMLIHIPMATWPEVASLGPELPKRATVEGKGILTSKMDYTCRVNHKTLTISMRLSSPCQQDDAHSTCALWLSWMNSRLLIISTSLSPWQGQPVSLMVRTFLTIIFWFWSTWWHWPSGSWDVYRHLSFARLAHHIFYPPICSCFFNAYNYTHGSVKIKTDKGLSATSTQQSQSHAQANSRTYGLFILLSKKFDLLVSSTLTN